MPKEGTDMFLAAAMQTPPTLTFTHCISYSVGGRPSFELHDASGKRTAGAHLKSAQHSKMTKQAPWGLPADPPGPPADREGALC